MTGRHRADTVVVVENGAAAAAAIDGTDEAFGDAFTRLADSVVAVPPSLNGALPADTWSEGPDRAEIQELAAEKEPVPLEEQDGLDDPVRMYLREIGKVHLLSGSDERRIARQMEEAKHLAATDKHWLELHGRAPTGQETVLTLIEQYCDVQKCAKFIGKDIGIKASLISDVIGSEEWRSTVDAEMDFSLATRLAEHLHIEQAEAEQAIVRLSIITHILQESHVRAMAERFGGEKSLLPPPWERVNGSCPK